MDLGVSAPSEVVVELRDVSVHFPSRSRAFGPIAERVRAVDGVSLRLHRGVTFGLVGDTGSGKSTIAHLIVGMVEPTAGMVRVAGREPHRLRGSERLDHRRRVQIVLQDPYSSLD